MIKNIFHAQNMFWYFRIRQCENGKKNIDSKIYTGEEPMKLTKIPYETFLGKFCQKMIA